MLPIFGKQNSLLLLGPIMLSLYTLNQDLFLCAENLKITGYHVSLRWIVILKNGLTCAILT